MKKWQQVSGHVLLERYGMTEIGMALSNPLKGERIPVTSSFIYYMNILLQGNSWISITWS